MSPAVVLLAAIYAPLVIVGLADAVVPPLLRRYAERRRREAEHAARTATRRLGPYR